jgi:hypothetical protein
MSAVESRADLPFYLIAAGGQHGVSEAHDGRYESEALRAMWRPARPFRRDVGRGAAHENPAVGGGVF